MMSRPRPPKPVVDEAYLNRPMGLGIPTSRGAAFKPLEISTDPLPPNAFREAEKRRQDAYRAALTSATPQTCRTCGTTMLAGATVCTMCCAPAVGDAHQPIQNATPTDYEAVEPVADEVPGEAVSRVLGNWPFGSADNAARWAASHLLTSLPEQRKEDASVPENGPNPFLAAARIQQARAEAEAEAV